jgi:hypothetical protein
MSKIKSNRGKCIKEEEERIRTAHIRENVVILSIFSISYHVCSIVWNKSKTATANSDPSPAYTYLRL